MAFETAAGASIAFSADAPATFDETGYAALTWATAAEVTNIGEFGEEYVTVRHSPLSSRGVKKAKGSYDNGTLTPTMAFDSTDAGQVILEAALSSDDPIYAKVELQGGDIAYFEVVVTALRRNVGESDSVVTLSPTLEVTDRAIVTDDGS